MSRLPMCARWRPRPGRRPSRDAAPCSHTPSVPGRRPVCPYAVRPGTPPRNESPGLLRRNWLKTGWARDGRFRGRRRFAGRPPRASARLQPRPITLPDRDFAGVRGDSLGLRSGFAGPFRRTIALMAPPPSAAGLPPLRRTGQQGWTRLSPRTPAKLARSRGNPWGGSSETRAVVLLSLVPNPSR